MSGYLVDTSVFVAAERGRPVREFPDGQARISVATLTELMVGARTASPEAQRLREETLAGARSFVALDYDEYVAERLADIVAGGLEAGRRVGLMDAIIAATALVHDLAVQTQDDDFEVLAQFAPDLRVVRP